MAMRTELHRWRWYLALVLAVGLLAPAVHADGLGVIIQRVDATTFPSVRVYVSVANANGIPITGLDQQAFQVQEDGKPVDVLAIEPVVDSQEPILTALAIDISGSMNDDRRIERAKDAAASFVDALGPADRMSVVGFASEVTVVQDYTADKAVLKKGIAGLTAQGNTQLYDAVVQAARRQASQSERRRPVIVMTDGDDTASAASVETAIAAATNAGSVVYAIGLGEANKEALGQIAAGTGGQAVYVSDPADLKATLLSINDNLRRQYVLRYTSKLAADTQAHGLAVQATYSGQQSTGLRSFTVPVPPTITIGGLTPPGAISGIQHVTVDVTGGAQSIQLLVDDQVVGTARSAPAAFDWDASRETAGPRRVIVRVTDMQGASTDKAFSVTIAGPVVVVPPTAVPAPTTAIVPTTGPVAVAQPTTVPAQNASGIDNWVLIGILLLLLLLVVALIVWYLSRRQNSRLGTAVSSAGQLTQVRPSGDTVVVARNAGGGTIVRPGPNKAKPAPQVTLKIVRGARQSEVATREAPITLGRAKDKATVEIDDSLVSGEHARIRRDGVQFSVEDLHSRNGTRLNGEPITPGQRRSLKSNDQIYMGDTIVTFVVDSR